jgi:DNA-binding NarL/FixJ family response regulator
MLAELGRTGARAIELAGEPGIGKTRLLAELGAHADAAGMVVLSGSASELEREVPFWIFVDALDDYVHALEPRRLALLDDESRSELAHVLPSFPAGEARASAPPEPHRTHRALRRLLEALAATKPLALLLDDLHWADSGSIELLGALMRRTPDRPVLFAVTVRPRQAPERLAGALAQARRAGALTRIELPPLTPAESGALLGGHVGASAAAALHDRSGGNPFYLEQLARAPRLPPAGAGAVELAGVELPRAVADALRAELALLAGDPRRLLDGASVAGDPFEAGLAAVAAELGESAAREALDELLARDLVRETEVPRRFRFRHPLVRRAVYDAAPGGWKLGAHERCAALLATRHAPAVERANHVERSAQHGDAAAIAVLSEAGAAAMARAPGTAARLFAAALRLLPPTAPERLELLGVLVRARVAAAELPEAHAAALDALELVPPDAVAARVELTAACAGIENLLGRHREAHTRLMAALDGLPGDGSREAAALMLQLGLDGVFAADFAAAVEWARRALDAARPLGDRPLTTTAAVLLAFAHAAGGSAAPAAAACDGAAALFDELGDDELAKVMFGGTPLAIAELALDRPGAAERHAERGLGAARSSGRARTAVTVYWVASVRRARGRLSDAAALFDAAAEFARVAGNRQGLGMCLLGASLTATAAGDTERALSAAEEGAATLASEAGFATGTSGFALAAALLPAGEPAHAVESLLTRAGGDELPRLGFWRADGFELLVRGWLALGRPEEAARAAVAAEALSGALGTRAALVPARRAAAAVALDAGDAAGAAAHALEGAEAADAGGAVVEAAIARALAGSALAEAGERGRAVTELERAATAFDACGATRRREAAERELRRLGRRGPVRRTRAGRAGGEGLETLTERELEIAELIVERLTNGQIAERLFLSKKTVETHIRNVFHKLDVSSRVEVARALERAGHSAGPRM